MVSLRWSAHVHCTTLQNWHSLSCCCSASLLLACPILEGKTKPILRSHTLFINKSFKKECCGNVRENYIECCTLALWNSSGTKGKLQYSEYQNIIPQPGHKKTNQTLLTHTHTTLQTFIAYQLGVYFLFSFLLFSTSSLFTKISTCKCKNKQK